MENRAEFLVRDPTQSRNALWTEFQSDVRHRLLHRNDPPPPPPPPPHVTNRGPRIKSKEPPPMPAEPQDWTGKVALALHNVMKKSQQRVTDVFKKFDTDGSNALDASEFHSAIIELGIPEELNMPEENLGNLLQEVFDTMDVNFDGVLSFKEINKYLRAGKHEIVLDEKLQAGAVTVQSADTVQTHRTRRKEEWKALDRFDALDVGAQGAATLRELTAFFLSEGYAQDFVREVMKVLDKNGDGSISAEEWRAGVRDLRGSSLLMSMTDPVEPPTGENFKDLLQPRELPKFHGYPRSMKGTVIYHEAEVKLGKTCRGCTIGDPEHRAIKLAQLRSVLEHVRRRCHNEHWVNTDGVDMDLKDVTMYDTAAYVIKPATKKRQCSFVEVVAKTSQTPKWFVSHWWGQPLQELFHCLEQHARDRLLDLNDNPYWISAFALSQWDIKTHITPDLNASVFLRAMNLCDGCVSVVCKAGQDYHSRIWCVFETGAALERSEGACPDVPATRGFLYDMYAPVHHRVQGELVDRGETKEGEIPLCNFYPGKSDPNAKPVTPATPAVDGAKPGHKAPPEAAEQRYAVGMTEGLAAADRDPRCKAAREEFFPVQPLEAALAAKLQNCKSMIEKDRTHLLNAIAAAGSGDGAAKDFDRKPDISHRNYNEYNGRIKSYIAKTSLVRAVVLNADGQPRMLETLLEGLHESTITKLEVNFAEAASKGLKVALSVYERILQHVPSCIEELTMQLPPEVTKLPDGRLKPLPKLQVLRLTGSSGLQELPDDVVECSALVELDLSGLTALSELPKKIFDLRSLQTLNISGCSSLTSIQSSGIVKSKLENLLAEGCTGLLDVPDTMGPKLANIRMLSLKDCSNVRRIPDWVPHLEKRGSAVIRPDHLT